LVSESHRVSKLGENKDVFTLVNKNGLFLKFGGDGDP
jgi:hypothetical protein